MRWNGITRRRGGAEGDTPSLFPVTPAKAGAFRRTGAQDASLRLHDGWKDARPSPTSPQRRLGSPDEGMGLSTIRHPDLVSESIRIKAIRPRRDAKAAETDCARLLCISARALPDPGHAPTQIHAAGASTSSTSSSNGGIWCGADSNSRLHRAHERCRPCWHDGRRAARSPATSPQRRLGSPRRGAQDASLRWHDNKGMCPIRLRAGGRSSQ